MLTLLSNLIHVEDTFQSGAIIHEELQLVPNTLLELNTICRVIAGESSRDTLPVPSTVQARCADILQVPLLSGTVFGWPFPFVTFAPILAFRCSLPSLDGSKKAETWISIPCWIAKFQDCQLTLLTETCGSCTASRTLFVFACNHTVENASVSKSA